MSIEKLEILNRISEAVTVLEGGGDASAAASLLLDATDRTERAVRAQADQALDRLESVRQMIHNHPDAAG